MIMNRIREPRDDSGMTLIEVLVVVILLGVIGTLTTRAIIDSNKLVRAVNDQTQGLSDVRVATERLIRDVRDARSVLCNPAGTPAALLPDTPCAYHLQLWIDYNSDYVQTADETVTWNLRSSSSPGQYDLIRTVNGSTQVEARTIVNNVAFTYDVAPGATAPGPGAVHTTAVNVNMLYDSVTNSGTSTKTVSVTGRLRNVK